MTTYRVKRSRSYFLAVLFACGTLLPTLGVELILKGGSLTLRAENEPLQEVLQAFAAYGVDVFVQPGVAATVNGNLVNQPIEEALDQIFEGFSYVTHWKSFKYSNEKVHTLKRIDLFLSGTIAASRHALPAGERSLLTLPSGTRYVANEILIGAAPGTSAEQFRNVLQKMGGHVVDVNETLGIYRIRLPANSDVMGIQRRLAALPEIAAAEPNLIYELPKNDVARAATSTGRTALTPVEGRPAVAILDSGLDRTFKDAPFIQASLNAAQPDQAVSDPNGHGTQMALIGSSHITPEGVDPEQNSAPIVAIQAFDSDGTATSFGMLNSLQFAQTQRARIVSMSWGTYERSQFLEVAMNQAANDGVLLLAAAGNDGRETAMYPAAFESVLAVAATNGDGELWDKSNYGSHIDLAAPGTALFPTTKDSGAMQAYAGTSISTPWVAKTISRYLELYPNAGTDVLRRNLRDSLSPIPGEPNIRQLDNAARERFLGTPP